MATPQSDSNSSNSSNSANSSSSNKSDRGFAAMKKQGREDEVRKIAQKGGQNSHKGD